MASWPWTSKYRRHMNLKSRFLNLKITEHWNLLDPFKLWPQLTYKQINSMLCVDKRLCQKLHHDDRILFNILFFSIYVLLQKQNWKFDLLLVFTMWEMSMFLCTVLGHLKTLVNIYNYETFLFVLFSLKIVKYKRIVSFQGVPHIFKLTPFGPTLLKEKQKQLKSVLYFISVSKCLLICTWWALRTTISINIW